MCAGVALVVGVVLLRVELALWLRVSPAEGFVAVEDPIVGMGTVGREAPGVHLAVGMGAGVEGRRI